MDLTTFIKEGHFEREVAEMSYNTKYHNLIYHACGRRDINAVKEFQRSVVEWISPALLVLSPEGTIPTIKNYSSEKKSDASHSSDDKIDFHTLLSPHKDT
jgi:hypothetical protein